jgi:ribonuclease HI
MCCQESTFHLFFECPFAVHIWSWFSSVIGINLHFQSIEDIWKVCDRNWNPQCKVVITASLVNIFSTIWFARNQSRFMDKNIHLKTAINMISANVLLSGKKTRKVFNSSMRDFSILKKFKIDIHPPKAPTIKEILWCPPQSNWMKCNTDGAATTDTASYGGIFRDHLADFRGGFAENIGKNSAFFAEILGAIRAIEIAFQNHWYNLWLETDSVLVVKAFSNQALIPWQLRNRWLNSLVRTRNMNFFVSHIFREGNECADAFANLGLGLVNFVYWNDVPQPVRDSLARNKMGFPCYRFSHREGFGLPPLPFSFCISNLIYTFWW